MLKRSTRRLEHIIFWVDPGGVSTFSPYFWAELMNYSNEWNRDTECDNSCIGKDSRVVICRNPVGDEKLDISQLPYNSRWSSMTFMLLLTGFINALRSGNTE